MVACLLFKTRASVKDFGVGEGPGDELEAHREAIGVKPTNDRVSRGAEDIEGAHEQSGGSANFELLAGGEGDGLLADPGGGDSS